MLRAPSARTMRGVKYKRFIYTCNNSLFSNDSEPPKYGTATLGMKMHSDELVLLSECTLDNCFLNGRPRNSGGPQSYTKVTAI
jgi:hypothetical protein